MVSNVNSIITSGDLGGGLIPTEYATQIIQDAPKSSVSLTRMRQIRMSTRTRTPRARAAAKARSMSGPGTK